MTLISGFGRALPLGLALALIASPALALTITNEDSDAQTLKIIKGKDSTELKVDPNQKAEADCTGGCIVEMEDSGDKYDMKGPESISIQDDVIYVDADPTVGEQPTLPDDHSTDQP